MPHLTTTTNGVETLNAITQMVLDHYERADPPKRILVSVSGIQGAGKSTLARRLADNLNSLAFKKGLVPSATANTLTHANITNPAPSAFAVDIPMDGFHLSRAQLRAMEDPESAQHRRGAAFTYDSVGYCCLVEKLARPINDGSSAGVVYAPAFDHATKDPVADSIAISSDTRIVILEGNYVNLAREPWKSASGFFDLKLSVGVDRRVAKERLVKRHVVSGICEDEASAVRRVESTDDLNAEDILANEVDGVVSVSVAGDC